MKTLTLALGLISTIFLASCQENTTPLRGNRHAFLVDGAYPIGDSESTGRLVRGQNEFDLKVFFGKKAGAVADRAELDTQWTGVITTGADARLIKCPRLERPGDSCTEVSPREFRFSFHTSIAQDGIVIRLERQVTFKVDVRFTRAGREGYTFVHDSKVVPGKTAFVFSQNDLIEARGFLQQ